jgi:hypothetical protein
LIPFPASLVLRRQWGINPGAPASLIFFDRQIFLIFGWDPLIELGGDREQSRVETVQQRGLPATTFGGVVPSPPMIFNLYST